MISSILKSLGVKTAFTPKDKSFFSSLGGIIPPTITGILEQLFVFNRLIITFTKCTCDPDNIDSPIM